jgi:hypothetical protein
VYLVGVYLVGVYLMGVHLTGVHLMGVYLMGRVPRDAAGFIYVVTAFGGRWPSIVFLILVLNGRLIFGPIALGICGNSFAVLDAAPGLAGVSELASAHWLELAETYRGFIGNFSRITEGQAS